tara:strand:- start:1032 stop:2435 length:1404 start_codon:yes stop_codon:yes gene_type:complete
MTQVPIISGIYADVTPDYRTAYPVNLIPVPKVTGISDGYLRTADGLKPLGEGPGTTRGGIEWRGICYRVMGSRLVSVAENGTVTDIGDVGFGGTVSMSYSFDHLAIASNGNLWLYDGVTLAQNVDADLGTVLDVTWVDGYFMTTDGESIVVTELGDPFSVNPLKYGSSEVDPDPVVAVVRFRKEIYAVNRNTIETFANVGGDFFPFQVINGAQIYRGAVGTHAVTTFLNGIVFVGSGRNEAMGVYMAQGGGTQKVSTREIDLVLDGYTEAELSEAFLEVKTDQGHEILYIHLQRDTLCFDGIGSQALGQPVWFTLTSAADGVGPYRGRHHVRAYDAWLVGDTASALVGRLDKSVGTHWGATVAWEFTTPIVYNEGKSVVIHSLELQALTGAVIFGKRAFVSHTYSDDGVNWSMPKRLELGQQGNRTKSIMWTRLGMFTQRRVLRFRGDSNAAISIARLDAGLEAMAW